MVRIGLLLETIHGLGRKRPTLRGRAEIRRFSGAGRAGLVGAVISLDAPLDHADEQVVVVGQIGAGGQNGARGSEPCVVGNPFDCDDDALWWPTGRLQLIDHGAHFVAKGFLIKKPAPRDVVAEDRYGGTVVHGAIAAGGPSSCARVHGRGIRKSPDQENKTGRDQGQSESEFHTVRV